MGVCFKWRISRGHEWPSHLFEKTYLVFYRFYLIPRAMSAAKCACCGSSISFLLDLIKFFRSPLAINSETSILQGVLYTFVSPDKSYDILKKYFRYQYLFVNYPISVKTFLLFSFFIIAASALKSSLFSEWICITFIATSCSPYNFPSQTSPKWPFPTFLTNF